MAVKKITRKVISPSEKDRPLEKTISKEKEVKEAKVEEASKEEVAGRPKKSCFFHQSKTEPSYTDMNVLRRFVTDRAKIMPKLKSNLCSRHQRALTQQIKYARHLALLPFTPKV